MMEEAKALMIKIVFISFLTVVMSSCTDEKQEVQLKIDDFYFLFKPLTWQGHYEYNYTNHIITEVEYFCLITKLDTDNIEYYEVDGKIFVSSKDIKDKADMYNYWAAASICADTEKDSTIDLSSPDYH